MENDGEAKCLLDMAKRRMKKKKGITFIFTGESGDGKSYAGMRFLELWYKSWFNEEFEISHVCNSLEEAILLIKSFKRIGEGLMIEELSVHASRRDALTTQNKLWNKFIDIVRIKQAIIIGNCPHISFIDIHILMMCQVWVNCELVDFKNKVVKAHPLWLQTSPHKKEPYKHKFLNKNFEEIDYCYFKLPNKLIKKDYDKLKDKSNDEMIDEIVLKLRYNRVQQLKKFGQKVLSPKQFEAYRLAMEGYSSKEAAKEMGLKHYNTYDGYLKEAKERLKSPQFAHFAKKMKGNEENREKIGEKPTKNATS